MSDISRQNRVKVGISIGDINGIGQEVILKTFMDSRMMEVCSPMIYGSSKVLSYHKKALELDNFTFNTIRDFSETGNKKLNLINCWDEDTKVEMGQATETGGKYALKSLEALCDDVMSDSMDVIVTAPINKHTIRKAGFEFAGHTEYLAKKFDSSDSLMMLVNENLRVALVTTHLPLSRVVGAINTDVIIHKLHILNESLKNDFNIQKPKIAVLGLNPHAGDDGTIGDEEIRIIAPAIKSANEQKIFATGPFGADAFFGAGTFKKYDAVLAMYHDQGLAPFKALAFGTGVNFTAGLPIVRTSPDHGTGFDIAGKGEADETSFRNAVYLA
ncbi:MAG: 4-hydroxythreonine-4-phosphate dehydrogenase PdxA, partial [Bacteroidia bacterium]|nr:4-hydroxythreonine-4-phosphate dehydrogenase PdxA [Bacteroidia bacterium]NNM16145.1 4-hydroxythreonine-4-phosphate dehydrogenase PdxA [Bacteroidia bacterium]